MHKKSEARYYFVHNGLKYCFIIIRFKDNRIYLILRVSFLFLFHFSFIGPVVEIDEAESEIEESDTEKEREAQDLRFINNQVDVTDETKVGHES